LRCVLCRRLSSFPGPLSFLPLFLWPPTKHLHVEYLASGFLVSPNLDYRVSHQNDSKMLSVPFSRLIDRSRRQHEAGLLFVTMMDKRRARAMRKLCGKRSPPKIFGGRVRGEARGVSSHCSAVLLLVEESSGRAFVGKMSSGTVTDAATRKTITPRRQWDECKWF